VEDTAKVVGCAFQCKTSRPGSQGAMLRCARKSGCGRSLCSQARQIRAWALLWLRMLGARALCWSQ